LSISSIAIEAIREKVLDYYSKRFLIIGAGDMAKKAIKKLSAMGVPQVTIANRTDAKSVYIAAEYGIQVCAYHDLYSAYSQYDILIFATSSSVPLLTHQTVPPFFQPDLVVDIGMPRNVDLGEQEFVITVEKLQGTANKSIIKRQKQVKQVRYLLSLELERLSQWVQSQLCIS